MRRLCFFLLPLVLWGCGDPDFNRPELLKAPRVLAVQAEPPQPGFGASTTLRALIYQPPVKTNAPECAGTAPGPQYQWSWCPLPTSSFDGYQCPMQQEEMDQLFAMMGVGAAPQLDLGTGESAILTNPFPAALLYGMCKGEIELLPKEAIAGTCRYSAGDHPRNDLASTRPLAFPVSVRLVYTPPCGSPPQDKFGPTLITTFTVLFPADETVPLNQNPSVGQIYVAPSVKGSATVGPVPGGPSPDAGSEPVDAGASYDGGPSDDGGSATLDGGGTVPAPPAARYPLDAVVFPRQQRVGLWLDVPMTSVEPLPRPASTDVVKDDPNDTQIYYVERLNIAWFTEAGDFGGNHGSGGHLTGFSPAINATGLTPDDDNTLELRGRQNLIALPLHEDYGSDTARLVVVVRDSRGGVTWTSGTLRMEDRP